MYRLIDDVGQRRLLYPAPTVASPDVLVLDIPAVYRGPGLALGRYYPILIEIAEEAMEVEAFLTAPRPTAVRPDLLERRVSSLTSAAVVITRYDPPQIAWPWVLTCQWPADLARAAARNGVDMTRGCYTMELFEEEAALERHMVALLESLRQHRAVDLKLISADRFPEAGSA